MVIFSVSGHISLPLKVTLIMLSPSGSSGVYVKFRQSLAFEFLRKKARLSHEMKPDGLLCTGIMLPSIAGISTVQSHGSTNQQKVLFLLCSFQLKQKIVSGKGCSLCFCTKDPEYRLCTRCDVTGTSIHWLTLNYRLERIVLNLLFFLPLFYATLIIVKNGKSWISVSWSDWQWGIEYGLKGAWLRYSQGPSFIFLVIHKTIQTICSRVTDGSIISTKMVGISSRRNGVHREFDETRKPELLTAHFVD